MNHHFVTENKRSVEFFKKNKYVSEQSGTLSVLVQVLVGSMHYNLHFSFFLSCNAYKEDYTFIL